MVGLCFFSCSARSRERCVSSAHGEKMEREKERERRGVCACVCVRGGLAGMIGELGEQAALKNWTCAPCLFSFSPTHPPLSPSPPLSLSEMLSFSLYPPPPPPPPLHDLFF